MSGSTAEKSDFIGGLRWHVPQPNPPTSECYDLVTAARGGDKAALKQCEGLYQNFAPKKRKPKPTKPPPRKTKRKLKLKRS